MRIQSFIFTLFLFLVIIGCSDSNDEKNPEILSVSVDKLNFKAEGEIKNFEIQSNTDWEILIEENLWCQVTPIKGNGNALITIETSENKTELIQSSILIVKSKAKSINIDIEQESLLPEIIIPDLEGFHFPLLTINTEGGKPIISKEDYLNAIITIESRNDKGEIIETLLETETEIKGRGSSTWDSMPKKPYRLKFKKSKEVLGMPKNKHWVLLANYADKTLLRNELAFEISRRMGFAYTPRMEYVDVIVNGNYAGNYMLVEHIRIDKNRVNIPELEPSDTDITGGYLLEIDERKGEPEWFQTEETNMIFCIKRPEDIPVNQKDYIAGHIQKVENILYGKDEIDAVTELPEYLDMKSFIDYLLLNEMAKNVDGNLRLSTFVYKNSGDNKIYFGPVWDYDIAFGNVDYDGCGTSSGWHASNAAWYQQFLSHSEFEKMVADRWLELRNGELASFDSFIDNLADKMEVSQIKNFIRWDILGIWVWPNAVVTGSYEGEINYLKDWLAERLNWMDQQLR